MVAKKDITDFFGDDLNSGVDPKSKRQGYVIAHNKSKENVGFILPKDSARSCQWKAYKTANWERHKFESGDTSDVLYLTKPRVLVLYATPLYAVNKESREFLGTIDWETYVHDSELFKLQRECLLMFLDEKNQFLHERPVKYKAQGTAGVSFVKQCLNFYQELENQFYDLAIQNGQEFPLGRSTFNSDFSELEQPLPWHNVSVFCPEFAAVVASNPRKPQESSIVCETQAYVKPTQENCFDFWRKDLKQSLNKLTLDAIGAGWGRRVLNSAKTEVLPAEQLKSNGNSKGIFA